MSILWRSACIISVIEESKSALRADNPFYCALNFLLLLFIINFDMGF
jgi:hypothetical protein